MLISSTASTEVQTQVGTKNNSASTPSAISTMPMILDCELPPLPLQNMRILIVSSYVARPTAFGRVAGTPLRYGSAVLVRRLKSSI